MQEQVSTEFCALKTLFVPLVFTAGRSSEAGVQNLACVSCPTPPHLHQGPTEHPHPPVPPCQPVRGQSQLPALSLPPDTWITLPWSFPRSPRCGFVTSALPGAVVMGLFPSLCHQQWPSPGHHSREQEPLCWHQRAFEGVRNALQTIFSLLLF